MTLLTLTPEAENERMHLMSFMTLKEPSIFFRAMILGAQGYSSLFCYFLSMAFPSSIDLVPCPNLALNRVYWNMFFVAYLLSPKTCHRFVGILEEEAVYT